MTEITTPKPLSETLTELGLVRSSDPRWTPTNEPRTIDLTKLGVIYKRQSLYEQTRKHVWSLLLQDELEQIAVQRHKYHAPLTPDEIAAVKAAPDYPHHYLNGNLWVEERDLGISGTLGPDDRRGLDEIIQMIERGQVGAIFAADISRLWRDKALTGEAGDDRALAQARSRARRSRALRGQPAEFQQRPGINMDGVFKFAKLCKDHKLFIVLPYEVLDMDSDQGWRSFVEGAQKAAQELQQMQRRLGNARRAKGRMGLHAGGATVPVGYQVQMDKADHRYYQKLIPLPPHDAIVRLIIEKYVALEGSESAVMHWARREGLRFPPLDPEVALRLKGCYSLLRGSGGVDGWPISISLIRSIVRNSVYAGLWEFAGTTIDNNHPAIVSPELMLKALILSGRRPRANEGEEADPKRDRRRDGSLGKAMLAGLVWCYNHDEPHLVASAGSMYICNLHQRRGEADHVCLTLTDYILDEPVGSQMAAELQFVDLVEQVIARLQTVSPEEALLAEERARRIAGLKNQIENAEENKRWLFGQPGGARLALEVDQQIHDLRREIAVLESIPAPARTYSDEEIEQVRELISHLGDYWDELSPERRQGFTHLALEAIHIKHTRAQIWCRVVWRTGHVQEFVIQRPFVDNRKKWHPDEDKIVREHYGTASEQDLIDMVESARGHRRTWVAISKRALELARREESDEDRKAREEAKQKLILRIPTANGGSGPNEWTPDELESLHAYWAGKMTKADLTTAIRGHSWAAIKTKANRLGLQWTRNKAELKPEPVPPGTFSSMQL